MEGGSVTSARGREVERMHMLLTWQVISERTVLRQRMFLQLMLCGMPGAFLGTVSIHFLQKETVNLSNNVY